MQITAHDHVEAIEAGAEAGLQNESSTVCASCAAEGGSTSRLMTRSDADRYLALATEQFDSLIKTGQVTPIRIRGQVRFDRRDLDLLVETYKTTALRRLGRC